VDYDEPFVLRRTKRIMRVADIRRMRPKRKLVKDKGLFRLGIPMVYVREHNWPVAERGPLGLDERGFLWLFDTPRTLRSPVPSQIDGERVTWTFRLVFKNRMTRYITVPSWMSEALRVQSGDWCEWEQWSDDLYRVRPVLYRAEQITLDDLIV